MSKNISISNRKAASESALPPLSGPLAHHLLAPMIRAALSLLVGLAAIGGALSFALGSQPIFSLPMLMLAAYLILEAASVVGEVQSK